MESVTNPEELRVPVFDAPGKAQDASQSKQAISMVPIRKELTGVGMKTKVVRTLVVYPRGRDPYFVYATAHGIKIPFSAARPTSREVDGVRWWKAN